MTNLNDQRVIAIEEHDYDQEVISYFQGTDTRTGGFVREKLEDVGAARIKSMDAAGIDVQILSHGALSTQKMDDADDLLAAVYNWFAEGFETADLQEAKGLLEALRG